MSHVYFSIKDMPVGVFGRIDTHCRIKVLFFFFFTWEQNLCFIFTNSLRKRSTWKHNYSFTYTEIPAKYIFDRDTHLHLEGYSSNFRCYRHFSRPEYGYLIDKSLSKTTTYNYSVYQLCGRKLA